MRKHKREDILIDILPFDKPKPIPTNIGMLFLLFYYECFIWLPIYANTCFKQAINFSLSSGFPTVTRKYPSNP